MPFAHSRALSDLHCQYDAELGFATQHPCVSVGRSVERIRLASCLILDVSLPGLNGLQLQERIAEAQSRLPIIFITKDGNVPMSVRAMKAARAIF